MNLELTPEQIESRKSFSDFVDEYIAPVADQYDRNEETPIELIKRLGEQGFLGAFIPEEYGGRGMDMVTAGLLCEEIGSGSASLLSLLTVNGMVSQSILKWGTNAQKEHWLPKLATGEKVAAFGVTEPNIGSDAKSVETTAELSGNSYIINGRKKWISYGQVADLFLILTQCDGK
ncbi:MAG: acyl-CoA dehydrogenase, partial [Candidatus Scalindua sp.]|nr:acyl-CoA dehydrogenase [Candidatus Scalindua sp.]